MQVCVFIDVLPYPSLLSTFFWVFVLGGFCDGGKRIAINSIVDPGPTGVVLLFFSV